MYAKGFPEESLDLIRREKEFFPWKPHRLYQAGRAPAIYGRPRDAEGCGQVSGPESPLLEAAEQPKIDETGHKIGHNGEGAIC